MKNVVLAAAVLALVCGAARADTTYVTVGSPYTGNSIPFWGAGFDAMRFQVLYLASEIGQAGYIGSWSLNSYQDPGAEFYTAKLLMCHTSATELGTNFGDNYGGNTPQMMLDQDTLFVPGGSSGTWNLFPTAFDYNGTDNLLVEISWHGDQGQTVRFYRNRNGTNRRAFAYDDTAKVGTVDDVEAYYARFGFVTTGVAEGAGPSPAAGLAATPTHGRVFTVRAAGPVIGARALEVLGPDGRAVDRVEFAGASARWSARGLPAGIYFLRVEDGSATARVVVTD